MRAADYRAAVMTEDGHLLPAVLDLAARYRLRTFHTRKARTAQGWRTPVQGDGKGWPDLVVVGPRGGLFRELKTSKGRMSREQSAWLEALDAAGFDVGVWRPDDLTSGRIADQLAAIATVRRWVAR